MLTGEEIDQILEEAKAKASGGISMLEVGQKCWFRNAKYDETDQKGLSQPFFIVSKQQFIYQGQVVARDEAARKLTIQAESGKIPVNVSDYSGKPFEIEDIKAMEYSALTDEGIPDMIEIDELNHATLLDNIKTRFARDEIFTYVGPTLLVLNPFKRMDHLYTEEMVQKYTRVKRELDPHVFAVPATAFKQMKENQIKQGIVISGESGAGKTESAKFSMKYLTALSKIFSTKEQQEGETGIEQKILNCNPVLEAFGNAKTVRNNNSSRFGKYVKLYFELATGEILGAETQNYLLEKSRVCKPTSEERNYHVFYHLLKGASEDTLKKIHLWGASDRMNLKDFNYLKCGADISQTIINDTELWEELDQTLKDLGFSEQEQLNVWGVVSCVLKLGQIEFDDSNYDESGTPCAVKNPDLFGQIAELLGLPDGKELEVELVNRPAMPGITQRSPLKKEDCYDARDSLAKALYNNLFCWLVVRMNLTIYPQFMLDGDSSYYDKTKTIGLLDIFGFEKFKENFFEQLCINYTNEKLHKLYISAVFDAEKMEMMEEGLGERVAEMKYPDNTGMEVIKMLDEKKSMKDKESKNGILSIVNDCCRQKPRPGFESVMNKIMDEQKGNVKLLLDFKTDKNKDKFTVIHSAKDVKYDMKTFVEKNIDELSSSMETLLNSKTREDIQNIYKMQVPQLMKNEDEEGKSGAGSRPLRTIWSKFHAQMLNLMEELAEPLLTIGGNSEADCEPCELHFIRCIKPNEAKTAQTFVSAMTLLQITYMGVLETIEVKKKNFPYRRKFMDFYERYEELSPVSAGQRFYKLVADNPDWKKLCVQILEETLLGKGKEYYVVGNTKILMKNEIVMLLEEARTKGVKKKNDAANLIKSVVPWFNGKVNNRYKKSKVVGLQRFWKQRGEMIQQMRAEEFLKQSLQAVARFKTEKRKDMEGHAAVVLKDLFKTRLFIDNVQTALKARKNVNSALYSYAYYMRQRKYYLCYDAAKKIVDNAWNDYRKRRENVAAMTTQRILRGHFIREKFKQTLLDADQAKLNSKKDRVAKVLQQRMRGILVRNRMKILDTSVRYLQGHMKAKWTNQLFTKLRYETTTIQRAVRKFLITRKITRERLQDYMVKEISTYKNTKAVESHTLFGENINGQKAGGSFVKPHSPYGVKKITLFARIADQQLLCDTSEVYEQPWSMQWENLSKECQINEQPIQTLSIGTTHNIGVNSKGKMYAWGWNEAGQCGKNPAEFAEINNNKQMLVDPNDGDFEDRGQFGRIKKVECGEEHNLVLDSAGNLYAFGSNSKGQLGLGHYEDQHRWELVEGISRGSIKDIAVVGDSNLACTQQGEAYMWPVIINGQKNSVTQQLPLPISNIKITKVACGYNFGLLMSNQGLVFSFGKENSEGQLGLGDTTPRGTPELVKALKDAGEKIDNIVCGFRHVMAKTSLGRVYTWGWGVKGQLGLNEFKSEYTPKLLSIEKNKQKQKICQIAAGYSHSLVMIEGTRDIMHFGTNGTLNFQSKPVKYDLSIRMGEIFPPSNSLQAIGSGGVNTSSEFAVVKINAVWSRTMSLTYFTIADLRSLDQPSNKTQGLLKLLSQQWQDQQSVDPPYIESIAGFFGANIMKMNNQQSGKKPSGSKAVNQSKQTIQTRNSPNRR